MAREQILVVEDNPINMELVCDILLAKGFVVYEATTGREALQMARDFKPNLIVMDLRLPDVDGLEVTREIKSDARTKDTVVVALTAHAMRRDELMAYEAGCSAYMAKPIDTREFARLIGRLLSEEESGRMENRSAC